MIPQILKISRAALADEGIMVDKLITYSKANIFERDLREEKRFKDWKPHVLDLGDSYAFVSEVVFRIAQEALARRPEGAIRTNIAPLPKLLRTSEDVLRELSLPGFKKARIFDSRISIDSFTNLPYEQRVKFIVATETWLYGVDEDTWYAVFDHLHPGERKAEKAGIPALDFAERLEESAVTAHRIKKAIQEARREAVRAYEALERLKTILDRLDGAPTVLKEDDRENDGR